MKGSVLESKVSVGFYVTESRILLLDETSMLYNVLERMTKRQKIRDLDISHVFVRILDCMISDDMLLLQKYSMVLDQMEDYLEENVSDLPHNFTSFIMQNKKELRALMVYYRSLNYMVDELAESDIFDGIVERRLQSFDNKATKLYAETASHFMRQHSSFVMCIRLRSTSGRTSNVYSDYCYYHIHAADSDRRVVW